MQNLISKFIAEKVYSKETSINQKTEELFEFISYFNWKAESEVQMPFDMSKKEIERLIIYSWKTLEGELCNQIEELGETIAKLIEKENQENIFKATLKKIEWKNWLKNN